MKRAFLLFLIVGLVLFGVSHAYAEKGSFASLSVGYVMPEDSDVEFDGGIDTEFELDDGFVVSGELGGYLTENLRMGTEVLYQETEADEASGYGIKLDVDGDVSVLGFMANLYYDFKNESRFTPFLNIGAGGAMIETDKITSPQVSNYYLDDDDDWVFAYQFGVGVSYSFNGPYALDLKYRYFATSDAHFDEADAEWRTHNVYVGYRYNF